jgi:hypothetical protein
VETVRLILQGRGSLHLAHNTIFFSLMHLRVLLDAAAFNRCILRCFLSAGIQATSGSTGLVAASATLVRGAPLCAVPCLGDWSTASAHFRFCHALYGIVGRHEALGLRCSFVDALPEPGISRWIGPPIGGGLRQTFVLFFFLHCCNTRVSLKQIKVLIALCTRLGQYNSGSVKEP